MACHGGCSEEFHFRSSGISYGLIPAAAFWMPGDSPPCASFSLLFPKFSTKHNQLLESVRASYIPGLIRQRDLQEDNTFPS